MASAVGPSARATTTANMVHVNPDGAAWPIAASSKLLCRNHQASFLAKRPACVFGWSRL